MNFSKEMLANARNAGSADELVELAKASGLNVCSDDAKKMFDSLKNRELSDAELDNVAGGCTFCPMKCEACGYSVVWSMMPDQPVYECPECHQMALKSSPLDFGPGDEAVATLRRPAPDKLR